MPRLQIARRSVTLEELKLRVQSDPDRIQRLITTKRAAIRKASVQKPIKKPITDHFVPYNYRAVKDPSATAAERSSNERARVPGTADQPEAVFTDLEEKVLLEKWSRYQSRLVQDQRARMDQFKQEQVAALQELQRCSPYLYELACAPDRNLKIVIKGSVSSPPKVNYDSRHVPIGEISTYEK